MFVVILRGVKIYRSTSYRSCVNFINRRDLQGVAHIETMEMVAA